MERQYYVVNEEEIMDDEKVTTIHVTNADYFDANGYQSDWTDEGVIEAVQQGGFQAGELQEGVIEVQATKEAVDSYLQSLSNFEKHMDFDEFITSFEALDC